MEMTDNYGKQRVFVVKSARFTEKELYTIYERPGSLEWASVQDVTKEQAMILLGALAICGAETKWEVV